MQIAIIQTESVDFENVYLCNSQNFWPQLYLSATTATEMTATLNKELQLVSEWVARNKLVLNISKNKSIAFGTKHSLNPKPQLNL